MRVLLRSYDLDLPGSGAWLRALAEALAARGCEVRATAEPAGLDDLKAWMPDVVVAQQWATEEANAWAVALDLPFVMVVHGAGQYECFAPACDLVVFMDRSLLEAVVLGPVPTVVFTDWDSLHARLQDIARAGRRRATLSLCMTVANEAETLEHAVLSVAGVVDEIIIGVDRKSTDSTAAIAGRLASDYFEYDEPSPPDFPRMRNRALTRVHTDWALVLDGHEWVENAAALPAALRTAAWSLELRTLFEPDEDRIPGLAFPFPRVHRRHVRFAGAAAHEEVNTPAERRVFHPEIRVWHERKPGRAAADRGREKSGAELDVLRIAAGRGDRRALFYLANGLRESGRFDEAASAYGDYLKSPNFAAEAWQATLFLARCRAALGQRDIARELLEQSAATRPDRAEAACDLGHLLLETDPRAAVGWFRTAAAIPEPVHERMFVQVPVYRWGAWHGLALALDRLGDYTGALEAAERVRAGGAGEWARTNVEYWRGKAAAEVQR